MKEAMVANKSLWFQCKITFDASGWLIIHVVKIPYGMDRCCITTVGRFFLQLPCTFVHLFILQK